MPKQKTDINHLMLSLPHRNHLGISHKNVHTGLFLFSGRALSSWCKWKIVFFLRRAQNDILIEAETISLSLSSNLSRIFSYAFIWLAIGLGSLAVLCPWLLINQLESLRSIHCGLLWWKSTNGYLKFFPTISDPEKSNIKVSESNDSLVTESSRGRNKRGKMSKDMPRRPLYSRINMIE